MLDSIHKQGYYISACSYIDFGGVFGVTIHQISSATFLQPGAWVATVTSVAAISHLESMYFYVGKNHKYHSSQRICFIFVLFCS